MIALALAAALGAPAATERPPRLALHVAGLGQFAAGDASATRRYREFAEDVVLEQDLAPGRAFGGEVGLTWAVTPRLGLAVAGMLAGGPARAEVRAALPHPLYLARPRQGALEPGGLRAAQRALHAGPVLFLGGGATRLDLAAGVTLVRTEMDVVSGVQYEHAYPFDEVRLTGSTHRRVSDTPVGFHVAAFLERRVRPRLFVLGGVRYTRASARPAEEGLEVELEAGGVTGLFGLRFRP